MAVEKIKIKNDAAGVEAALEATERYAGQRGISGKNRIHLNILSEELIGMVKAITKEFEAEYWIDDEEGIIKLYLEAETVMDSEKKINLVSVSKSQKNEAAKGLMGKIRDVFEYMLFSPADVADMQLAQIHTNAMMMGGYVGAIATDYIWSLERYRYDVKDAVANQEAQEAWDELEKSVIANLADDVRVWVRGNKVRLVIELNAAGVANRTVKG